MSNMFAPHPDEVRVVRCEFCPEWDKKKNGACKRFSYPPFVYCHMKPNDYCSYGKRGDQDA